MKPVNEKMLINIEGKSDYNIPLKWFYDVKPKGISGVARLKNADCFLEKCLLSHLPFLDELILVDNLSNDNTKKICMDLEKKYEKVKFFEYPFRVSPPSDKNLEIPGNSVHSLAYYYNWCFSKAKYSHVMKVDDDNLLLNEKWQRIREKSLLSKHFNTYRGINLIKDSNGKMGTIQGYEYSGKYGDIGIYPVSPYTYYVQGKSWEVFENNLRRNDCGFGFFHLKFLKPHFGFHNLLGDGYQKWYESKIKNAVYIYDFKNIVDKNDETVFSKYFKEFL